jgi:predicted outer membrane protein
MGKRTLNALAATIVIAAMGMGALACGDGGSDHQTAASSAADSAQRAGRDTAEAGGEVVSDRTAVPGSPDSTSVRVRWVTDANIVSLLRLMNSRAISAAEIELDAWHSDTVKNLAIAVEHDHAQLQHWIDSVAERAHINPVAPALAVPITVALQAQIDSFAGNRGMALDRAYVRQAVATHQLMAGYVEQLSSVAEAPEVVSMLNGAASRFGADLQKAQDVESIMAAADSLAAKRADSAEARANRHRK